MCSAKRTIHNVPHSPNASCFGPRLSWQQWRQQSVTVIQCRAAYVTCASSPSQVGLTTLNEVNWHQNISCSWGKNKQVAQRTADKKKTKSLFEFEVLLNADWRHVITHMFDTWTEKVGMSEKMCLQVKRSRALIGSKDCKVLSTEHQSRQTDLQYTECVHKEGVMTNVGVWKRGLCVWGDGRRVDVSSCEEPARGINTVETSLFKLLNFRQKQQITEIRERETERKRKREKEKKKERKKERKKEVMDGK